MLLAERKMIDFLLGPELENFIYQQRISTRQNPLNNKLILELKEIIKFQYDGSVLRTESAFGQIVIGVHNKQITHRSVAPLDSTINVEVICLSIVLQKCGPE
jgi:hypothetical protein